MIWVLVGSFLAVSYVYFAYPLLMQVLASSAPKSWMQAPFDGSVSIIVAAWNAERFLPDQLSQLALLPEEIVKEIIVVSDGSTDATVQILEEFQCSRLRRIVRSAHAGKASALNSGIHAATGDILFFVDVRPKFDAHALSQLLTNFADPAVGCVTGELTLNTGEHHGTTKAVSGLYWRYEQWIRKNEAKWDSPLGVYGGFYAVRASLVDPFPEGLVLDDMYLPLSIVRKGYRCVIDEQAQVSDTWPTEVAGEFRRKIRTLAGNFQLIALCPELLSIRNRLLPQLVSHKLGRLAAPYLMMIMLVASTFMAGRGVAWMALALAQWVFWSLAALGLVWKARVFQRVVSPASAFLVLNAAAVAALYIYLFTNDPLHKIWTKTPSDRTAARWSN